MKNLVKNTFLAVMIFSASSALAYDQLSTFLGGQTNQVAIGGTNAIPTVVYASKANVYDIPSNSHNTNQFNALEFPVGAHNARIMPVQVSFVGSAASTANLTVWFNKSDDRANWVTNALIWAIPATGLTPVTAITNIDTLNTPFWCITTISNADGAVNFTNLSITASAINGL